MRYRIVLGLLICLGFARAGAAHEFWVQPSDFWVASRAAISLSLQVGDASSQQRSPISPERITRFEAIGPAGDVKDARGGSLRLADSGAYVVVLETDNRGYSHQSAERFNAYLEAEGLTPAIEYRSRTHQMHVDGFERYSRVAKSLLLVGSRNSPGRDRITRPLGVRLEIVPQVSPYDVPRPAQFPVQVLYEGRPLTGALVKLVSLDRDLDVADQRRTNVAGVATFAMPASGRWLIDVIWTERLANAPDADYETTFSSLTFGVPSSRSPEPAFRTSWGSSTERDVLVRRPPQSAATDRSCHSKVWDLWNDQHVPHGGAQRTICDAPDQHSLDQQPAASTDRQQLGLLALADVQNGGRGRLCPDEHAGFLDVHLGGSQHRMQT
jgi:uncharacterized GH25 family protein